VFTQAGSSDANYQAPSLAIAPSLEEWERRFNIFTFGVLEGMNWSNVFCAGGSVLGSLLAIPGYLKSDKEIARYYTERWTSDIDLFLWGDAPDFLDKVRSFCCYS
jgi:hypothetical protein